MEKPIQIIFCEDKPRFRKAILDSLEDSSIICIAECGNGKELLEQLTHKKPDVVLLDLEMPVMDGNETMKCISEKYPGVRVIILSMHYEYLLVEDYITRGASGYIPKDEIAGNIGLLIDGIKKVNSGETFIHHLSQEKDPLNNYTPTQKVIIPLICEGKTNKQIAEELNILERSVEKQRQKIYEKTNVSKATDFFKYAFSKGLQFLGKRKKKK
jgi:DNA-binding NarL/FixJ family response regulator